MQVVSLSVLAFCFSLLSSSLASVSSQLILALFSVWFSPSRFSELGPFVTFSLEKFGF